MPQLTQSFIKIKAPFQKTQYTRDQFQELLKCASDPLYFIENYVYVQHPTQGRKPFKMWDFQKKLVSTYWKYTNSICMILRQSGKTASSAAYLLWYACFNPDVTILIAAHKFKAASEIMMRVKYAYEELPDFLRPGVTKYNQQNIAFDNGSRIVATTTTADSGRGMSISLLYLDEFAFVKKNIATEFWASISPTLSTGGRCIITTTPKSDEDMFAELWFGANKLTDQ